MSKDISILTSFATLPYALFIVSFIDMTGPLFGSPAWDRTTDTLINSQVLLPLSY